MARPRPTVLRRPCIAAACLLSAKARSVSSETAPARRCGLLFPEPAQALRRATARPRLSNVALSFAALVPFHRGNHRPATPAAMNPGRPCTRTSSTARGWSAGDITRAKPSPGAFFRVCTRGRTGLGHGGNVRQRFPCGFASAFLGRERHPLQHRRYLWSRGRRVSSRYASAIGKGAAHPAARPLATCAQDNSSAPRQIPAPPAPMS